MRKELLPTYQIQDFEALAKKEHYFYFSTFAAHVQEHLFIRVPHKHNFYIILFITNGTGTHTIDFQEYTVAPGMVFFMTPGQVHSWKLSDDIDGFVLFFTQEFYVREYPNRMLFDYPFFNALLNKPVLKLIKENFQSLLLLLQKLRKEYEDTAQMREVMLSRYLDILLIELTRLFQPNEKHLEPQSKERTLLQKLERLIDVHYTDHKPVAFYADCLNVTQKHLNDNCKRYLGKTTKELILNRTLLEAQRLLVHADLTSSQIAHVLGYFDNTYFFRFFKKHVGYTPEQFRAANK